MRGFRVYDKQEKRMIDNPCTEGMYLSGNGNLIKPANLAIYLMDRYVRMDSMGSTDVNGKEIYEGDIVTLSKNIDKPIADLKELWQVIYQDSRWGFIAEPLFNGLRPLNASWTSALSIISNIYDNPELLKEVK
jgi:hypothetical protein